MPLLGLPGQGSHRGHLDRRPDGGTPALPCPRAGPPPSLELAIEAALLELCLENRARLKSEKVDALPLGLDDLGEKGPLFNLIPS